jgi:hypothetical protein
MPNSNEKTTPDAENIRYVLNASTFPGNSFEVNPLVFVDKNVYELPQKTAHIIANPYDF